MKKLVILLLITVSIALSTNAQENKRVDTGRTKIVWTAEKIGGSHTGYVKLKSGKLTLENGVIKSGIFIVDMASISDTDIENESLNQKLVGHLKSADFFDATNFPESILEVKRSTKSGADLNVYGNLKIKGKTNPVTFKATPTSYGYEAEIVVDRTSYDVRYGSAKFFDNLANNVIDDEFKLNVQLYLDN